MLAIDFCLAFDTILRSHYCEQRQRVLLSAKDLCTCLGFTNVSSTLTRYVFEDYVITLKSPENSRPTLYLSEPGVRQLLCSSKHPSAIEYQKMLYTSVYISEETANSIIEIKSLMQKITEETVNNSSHISRLINRLA